MLLVIDNFDSFTYNLVQYFGQQVSSSGLSEQCNHGGKALALNPTAL